MTMSMPGVFKCLDGSASFVLWRPGTKWGSKCSTLPMVLFTLMVLTVANGFVATNARKGTIWSVLHLRNQKKLIGHSCAHSMPVGSRDLKRVTVVDKRVTKRVIFPVLVPKQKTTAKKIRRGVDGRRLTVRKAASSGKGRKEQLWQDKDMDKVFEYWAENDTLPPGEKHSINWISKETGVPYTTCCERLKGRRGGGKKGKIAGGRRMSRALSAGESG